MDLRVLIFRIKTWAAVTSLLLEEDKDFVLGLTWLGWKLLSSYTTLSLSSGIEIWELRITLVSLIKVLILKEICFDDKNLIIACTTIYWKHLHRDFTKQQTLCFLEKLDKVPFKSCLAQFLRLSPHFLPYRQRQY